MRRRNHYHPCAINDTERVTKIYFNRWSDEKAWEGTETVERTRFEERSLKEENRADKGAAAMEVVRTSNKKSVHSDPS